MEAAQIHRLCQSVTAAVAEIRAMFRSAVPVSEVLDRFWRLQDNLSRLLEVATDYPVETRATLKQHPRLLIDVVDVLEFSAKLQALRTVAAVRDAIESINNSLLEIEYLRQSRAFTALT